MPYKDQEEAKKRMVCGSLIFQRIRFSAMFFCNFISTPFAALLRSTLPRPQDGPGAPRASPRQEDHDQAQEEDQDFPDQVRGRSPGTGRGRLLGRYAKIDKVNKKFCRRNLFLAMSL